MSTTFVTHPRDTGILILDYGSQYTLLIARRLRELGSYTEVIDARTAQQEPAQNFRYAGVILSGGPDSVGEEAARSCPAWVLKGGKPVLGICYGLQLLVNHLGGTVSSGGGREYGSAQLAIEEDARLNSPLFSGIKNQSIAWMSHGDHAEKIPSTFKVIAKTDSNVIAALESKENKLWGLQFHPEVQHTQEGAQILKNFAQKICGLTLDWQPNEMIKDLARIIQEEVKDGLVLMAVSGGVDSTVAATLIAKAIGNNKCLPVFVNTGLLRKNEVKWVQDNFTKIGVKLETLEKSDLFLQRLKNVTDPEEKRKIIGRTFIEVFEHYAKNCGLPVTHLGQGTLYPDVIESGTHGSGAKVIKSHHNVGGLPEKLNLKIIEPFRYLFKDEVRRLGEELGLSHDFVWRHPFPGPGLAVRILGEITADKIKLLQDADDIFITQLREQNLYNEVWQAFAVLLPVKSVGVMGDNRTYEWTLALRAVTASDGMTADVAPLEISFLSQVATKIVREVRGINRVTYDVTSKPPGTIEWE